MNDFLELWKPIIDFESSYEISNLGRVHSIGRCITDSTGRNQHIKSTVLKCSKDSDGYLYVTLTRRSIGITKKIHRLVAEAFIPNIDNKPEVNHKDGDKNNNCADNLEWVTSKENIQHAFRTGLRSRNQEVQKCQQMSRDNCKQLICVETGQLFDSYVSAAKYFNVSSSNIAECVHKGWRVCRTHHLMLYTSEVRL